jgi:catechol 2,3-dioxygenase-like lactoylglutathione lyase family enzyme
MSMLIDHVQVSCPPGGEGAARRFYVDALGMVERPKPPVLAARGGAWFQSGNAWIHVGVETGFRPARKAHPALGVDDLDAVAVRVAALGFPVTWDDAIPGVRRFHTVDGNGNRVELQANPAADTSG